jgi:hypothetical protein
MSKHKSERNNRKIKTPKTKNSLALADVLDTPDKVKAALTILMNGKDSDFWKLILRNLDYNIQTIEEEILENDDLTFEKREELRWRRYYQVELRNTPDNLIAQWTPKTAEGSKLEDLDPYD